jgi:hypothetical protein
MILSIANFESSEFFVNMGAKIWAFASDAVFLRLSLHENLQCGHSM